MNNQRPGLWLIVAAVAVTVVLAVGTTLAFAAARGTFRSFRVAPNGGCTAPPLPGTVVHVELVNMGGRMMMGGMVGGTMRAATSDRHVPASTVSLRVANVGSLVHELVVLPLSTGENVGQRTVGTDGKVDEAASVGEVSRTCGEGAGDGINPGAIGWVTLNLPAGTYELICNLPGHYAAGMYTELQVG